MPIYIPTRLDRLIQASLRGEHDYLAAPHKESMPNFIVIGAAKSATTSLASVFRKHSQVHFSSAKEPKFFGRNYERGWSWYSHFFEEGKDKPLRGEASTMYSSTYRSFRYTPQLIKHHLGEIKIIYVIRHPLQRIVSHWRHYRGRHPDCPGFDQLITSKLLRKHIIDSSLYYEQLKRYLHVFPREMIYCVTYEELTTNPKETLRKMFEFLSIRDECKKILRHGQLQKRNLAGSKGRDFIQLPKWPPELREKLVDIIKPDSERILDHMNYPHDTWDWSIG